AARGTLAYMSPEQAAGEAVDERTDIFSLGVVLYEMLTGKNPFRAATPMAIAQQIVEAPAPPPSSVKRGLPPALDAVVAKALEKRPVDRYSWTAMLAADLRAAEAALDEQQEPEAPAAAPVKSAPRPGPTTRPRAAKWPFIVAALVAAALLVA